MGSFDIVAARPEDAAAIGEIRAINWYEQYANLPDADSNWVNWEVIRLFSPRATDMRSQYIEAALHEGARNFWRVAKIGNRIIGFAEARLLDDDTQELRSLHMMHGQRDLKGGQGLTDTVYKWFDPERPIRLDVASTNTRGQAFYEREPNNFYLTEHQFTYGPVLMQRMQRDPVVG